MKEGQKGIYWLAADNKTAAASAPFVEGLAKRDLEVLFLTDAIDEVAFQNLSKYGEHNLVDVSREQVDLGDSAETAEKVLVCSSPPSPNFPRVSQAAWTCVCQSPPCWGPEATTHECPQPLVHSNLSAVPKFSQVTKASFHICLHVAN